ncbi:hypothetical protein [Dinoroseobacter sp. S76]|uniref:hypothetical protein n=1 Tax=Dinoroseobacter sp. S76 TaxID=3415124 RepID=UPI003C7B50D1
MRLSLLLLCLVLAGCSGPGLDYRGVPATRVAQAGYTFDLYFNGRSVRGIRLNQTRPVSRRHFRRAFYDAVEATLGCHVLGSTMDGDLVMLTVDVYCAG